MRAAEKSLRESRRSAQEYREKCAPFNKISSTVLHAAQECTKRIAPFIEGDDRDARQALVFTEFLFFFAYLCDRIAFLALGAERAGKLKEIIWPHVFGVTVDMHFPDAPPKRKKELSLSLYMGAKDAAKDYVSSPEWLSKEEPYTGNSLLSKLSRRVMSTVGGEVDPRLVIAVIEAASNEEDDANFDALLEAIKPVIDDFEIFPYEPWDDPDYISKLQRGDT
ncbi:MAG TPA: hypothetical protein VHY59_10545 [Chthoniobacterales bacterium]|nr:hypothetical protein [Chthoniobacterales bacterium]